MATVHTYRDLEAWQARMLLVEECYRMSAGFPREELFGLTAQLRRAAVSIPANLSEGACRHTTKAFIYHVSIALGSHAEVETCVEIALRLGYVSAEQRAALMVRCDLTGRLLSGLLRALQSR
jgi:four helix bundle protein